MNGYAAASESCTCDGTEKLRTDVMYAVRMLERLNEQRLCQDPSCDFTIAAGNRSFKVHKAVLVASSEYFRAMLRGPMVESSRERVDLKAISGDALAALVAFVYTGRLALTWDSVAEVVHAASHLQLDDALERCCSFLVSRSDGADGSHSADELEGFERLCDLRRVAETYSLAPVAEYADMRLAAGFESFAFASEFLTLGAAAVSSLLALDCLVVGSELWLFQQADRWRRSQVPPCCPADMAIVFGQIRYALMAPDELLVVGDSFAVASTPRVRGLVASALEFHRRLEEGLPPPLLSGNQSTMRACRDSLVVAIEGSSFSKSFQVVAYDLTRAELRGNQPQGDFYRLYSDDASDSRTCGITAVDGFVYILSIVNAGGFDQDRFLSLSRIDPRGLHTARELRRMPKPRQVGAFIASGQHVYAVGGACLSGISFVATCERYSVARDIWEDLTPLPVAAHFVAAAERQGVVYVSGGQVRPSGPLSRSCWRLQTDLPSASASVWHAQPDMLYARRSHAMVAVEDKLYVLGGLCDHATTNRIPIELLDTASHQWTELETPPTLSGTSLGHYVSVGGSIYVLGHELYSAHEDEIWRLHPAVTGCSNIAADAAAMRAAPCLLEEKVATTPGNMSLGYAFASAMKLNFRDPLIAAKRIASSRNKDPADATTTHR